MELRYHWLLLPDNLVLFGVLPGLVMFALGVGIAFVAERADRSRTQGKEVPLEHDAEAAIRRVFAGARPSWQFHKFSKIRDDYVNVQRETNCGALFEGPDEEVEPVVVRYLADELKKDSCRGLRVSYTPDRIGMTTTTGMDIRVVVDYGGNIGTIHLWFFRTPVHKLVYVSSSADFLETANLRKKLDRPS